MKRDNHKQVDNSRILTKELFEKRENYLKTSNARENQTISIVMQNEDGETDTRGNV